MIAPTRISIDAVHAPVYYVESVTSTLDLAASLLADTRHAHPPPDDDHPRIVKAQDEAVSAAPGLPPPGQALLASTIISLPVSLHADALGWIVHCVRTVRAPRSGRALGTPRSHRHPQVA